MQNKRKTESSNEIPNQVAPLNDSGFKLDVDLSVIETDEEQMISSLNSDITSKRTTRSQQEIKSGDVHECVGKSVDPDGYEKQYINHEIGFGVFTVENRAAGDFLLEYCGELIGKDEGLKREKDYSNKEDIGSYLFFFTDDKKNLCVDATGSNRLGAFVNDSIPRYTNCEIVKKHDIENKPHLCLIATRNIEKGEELRYNYGAKKLWWRKKGSATIKPFNLNNIEKTRDIIPSYSQVYEPQFNSDKESLPLELNNDQEENNLKEIAMESPRKQIEPEINILAGVVDTTYDIQFGIESVIQNQSTEEKCIVWTKESGETSNVIKEEKKECITRNQEKMQEPTVQEGKAEPIAHNAENIVEKKERTEKSKEEHTAKKQERVEELAVRNQESEEENATKQERKKEHIAQGQIGEACITQKEVKNSSTMQNKRKTESSNEITNQVAPLNDSGFELDVDLSVIETDEEQIQQENTVELEKKKNKRKKRKPKRLCIFCRKRQTYLRRHIKTKHKNLSEVKRALGLKGKDQDEAFQKFRRKGIFEVNQMEACKPKPAYERERTPRVNDISQPYFCSHCLMFCNRKYWFHHRKICQKHSCKTVLPIPATLLETNSDISVTDEFRDKILANFRDDNAGRHCRKDPAILTIGSVLFNKEKRKVGKASQVKKSVRTNMRRLAHIYIIFSNFPGAVKVHNNVFDLFNRSNFSVLTDSINKYSTGEDSELKAGLKQNLFYLLKRSAKILKGFYLSRREDTEADEIDKFVSILEMMEDYIFGDATYQLNKNKNVKLRKPSELPLEKDVQKFQTYIMGKMQELLDPLNLFDSSNFVELRDCACARLTLLNARRGGEAARLLLDEFNQALNDSWIDQQRLEELDELDKILIKELKITYMTGKGNNHLVPLLIPPDTLPAVKKLADKTTRVECGVLHDNLYLFASTKQSEQHTSGWHSIFNVMQKVHLEKPENFKATNNRHRVATLFSALNLSSKERDLFFKHMGHSEQVNINSYQAPPGIMEVTSVGRNLIQLDKGIDRRTNVELTSGKHTNNIETMECSEPAKTYTLRKKRTARHITAAPVPAKKRIDDSTNDEFRPSSNDSSEGEGEGEVNIEDNKTGNLNDLSESESEGELNIEDNKTENLTNKSFRWTAPLVSAFNYRFKDYIDRTAEKPMPSKEEMTRFLSKHDQPTENPFVVRNRINNERCKQSQMRKENLKLLNIS